MAIDVFQSIQGLLTSTANIYVVQPRGGSMTVEDADLEAQFIKIFAQKSAPIMRPTKSQKMLLQREFGVAVRNLAPQPQAVNALILLSLWLVNGLCCSQLNSVGWLVVIGTAIS